MELIEQLLNLGSAAHSGTSQVTRSSSTSGAGGSSEEGDSINSSWYGITGLREKGSSDSSLPLIPSFPVIPGAAAIA